MTRGSDRKPSPGPAPSQSRGEGGKPGRSGAGTQVFAHFVSTLARLERAGGRPADGKERGR